MEDTGPDIQRGLPRHSSIDLSLVSENDAKYRSITEGLPLSGLVWVDGGIYLYLCEGKHDAVPLCSTHHSGAVVGVATNTSLILQYTQYTHVNGCTLV